MDDIEFGKIVRELKDKGCIRNDRIIERNPGARWHGFAVRGIGTHSVIYYYPRVFEFLDKNQLRFILLHEEGHCASLRGSIPRSGESSAMRYAKEYIKLIDPTTEPDKAEKSARKAISEYRKTVPLNFIQRLLLRIPLGEGLLWIAETNLEEFD